MPSTRRVGHTDVMPQVESQPGQAGPNGPAQIREWRLAQLSRAGFDPKDAALLADDLEVDLHEALRLVERGCPPKIALQILL